MTPSIDPPRRRRAFLFLLLAVGVLAAGIYTWQLLRPDPAPQSGGWRNSNAAVPVRIAVAVQEDLDVRLKALGTVTPLNTVTVRSRIDGELVRVAFEEGQFVDAGTLLAQIDPRPYRIRLAQAEGQQKQNLAELDNARIELDRFKELQTRGYVSGQDLSNQDALVRQYDARRQTDQAAVDEARLQLSYTNITAPISGRIGLRAVDVGNLVTANAAEGIATITQMQPASVLFTVPESDLPAVIDAVRADSSLAVAAWDREERQVLAEGTLSSLDNRIDTSTGTLRLRATFANEDERLFPNQFVNVQMRVRSVNAVVIPNAAIQYGANGSYVFLVDAENVVSLREIVPGAADGERIAVTDGLAAGDRVVLEGLDRLREGSTVEIVADADADPDAASEPVATPASS